MISIKVGLIGSIVINTMAYLILELKDFFLIKKIKNIVNTEYKKRLLGNFFSLSVLQVFTYILPLCTALKPWIMIGNAKYKEIILN